MASHASNMARHARRGGKRVRHAADEARNGVMHTVREMGNEAVGALRDGYDDLRDTASDYIGQGREKFESVEQSVEKQIKQHPLTSVMASLGIGFLLGFLYSRR